MLVYAQIRARNSVAIFIFSYQLPAVHEMTSSYLWLSLFFLGLDIIITYNIDRL